MRELFTSGHVIDVILVLVVVQGLFLLFLHDFLGLGVHPRDYLFNVLPGVCMMLALRGALVDAQWSWIALCLLAALLTHWLELWRYSGIRREAARGRPW